YKSPRWQSSETVETPPEDAPYTPRSDKPPPRQTFLTEAIDRWIAANGCSEKIQTCPPAILVAAEGGATRAAFFTASVLGGLIDSSKDDAERHRFENALFAMSGVSGGALGVTTVRTALVGGTSGTPPCRYSDALWFGTSKPQQRNFAESWRSCLQLLTAG